MEKPVAKIDTLMTVAELLLAAAPALERIFSYCSVRDLQAIRLTCRALRNASLQAWQNSGQLVISSDNRLLQLEKFIKMYGANSLPSLIFLRWESSPRIISKIGYYVQKLTLDQVQFISTEYVRNALFNSCPNMVELHLGDISIVGQGYLYANRQGPTQWVKPEGTLHKNLRVLCLKKSSVYFPLTWMETLTHFPNIESLVVANEDFSLVECLARTIQLIRLNDQTQLALTELVTPYAVLPEMTFSDILNERTLGLSPVAISMASCGQPEHVAILSTLAHRIKKLTLFCAPNEPIHFMLADPRKVQLTNLTDLKIKGVMSLNFLKCTPALEMLEISEEFGASIERTRLRKMKNFVLPKLTQLRIKTVDGVDQKSFLKYLDWFPNLTKLDIGIMTDDGFFRFFGLWTHLKNSPAVIQISVDDCLVAGTLSKGQFAQTVADVDGDFGCFTPIAVPFPKVLVSCKRHIKDVELPQDSRDREVDYCAVIWKALKELAGKEQKCLDES